jgi:hypothetical protein
MSTRSSERSSSRRMGAVSSSRRMGAVRVVAIRAAARAHVIRKRIFFNRALLSQTAERQLFYRGGLRCSGVTKPLQLQHSSGFTEPMHLQQLYTSFTTRRNARARYIPWASLYQHTDRNRNSAAPVRYIRNLRLDDVKSKDPWGLTEEMTFRVVSTLSSKVE